MVEEIAKSDVPVDDRHCRKEKRPHFLFLDKSIKENNEARNRSTNSIIHGKEKRSKKKLLLIKFSVAKRNSRVRERKWEEQLATASISKQ